MVSEFIELRSPTGNNRPTGNNSPARFWGIWGDFWGIWAHAMRPYGFLGYLGARDAPRRVFGLFGFFGGGFWVIWAHAIIGVNLREEVPIFVDGEPLSL
ncbi:hypothetical protein, partial [Microcystis aeruginosa]|uniref:hypothetical protein n=1 Tax=Microcystis aeruginosa TaxID=1126 RepID=UPI00232B2443